MVSSTPPSEAATPPAVPAQRGGAAGGWRVAAPAPALRRPASSPLTIASFVPDTDKELKRQFEEWGKQNKVKVRPTSSRTRSRRPKGVEVAKFGHDLTAGPGWATPPLFDYQPTPTPGRSAPRTAAGSGPRLPDPATVTPLVVAAALPDGDQDRHPKSSARRRPTPEDYCVGKKAKAIGHPFGTAWATAAMPTCAAVDPLSYGGPTSPRTARPSPSTRPKPARRWSS